VDKLAVIGSTATAKKVMATCAETLTPILAEGGGKDAMIVAADADLDAAAEAALLVLAPTPARAASASNASMSPPPSPTSSSSGSSPGHRS
jgi:hypothetical protein